MTELQQALDRLNAQGLVPTPDPAQVQGQVDAFLLALGRHVAHDHAQDLDLDHANEDDLRELGRLHCIALYPTLPQDLAVKLEWVACTRDGDWDGTSYSPWPRPAPERDRKPIRLRSGESEREHGLDQGRLAQRRAQPENSPVADRTFWTRPWTRSTSRTTTDRSRT
jgi:hypothetical protein